MGLSSVVSEGSPTNPPRDVKVTVLSETDVRITWKEPALPSPRPTSYTITRNIVDETDRPQDFFNIELAQSKTSFKVQGLKPYTTFAFHVRAFNSKGSSPASEVVYATTEESVPITYPKILELTTPTPNSILVTWQPLTKAEARGKVDHYMIFYRWNSTTSSAKVSPDKHSHTLTHTHPNTIYSIRVLGATAKGFPPVDKLNQPWEKITTPRQPTQNGNLDLEVTRLNNSAISVSWRVLSKEEEVSGYQVILEKAIGREQLGPFRIPASQNSSVFTNLENNTWYEVTVEAFSTAGVFSKTKSVSTRSPVDLPPPPQELDGEALSANSIKVNWKPPPTDMTIDSYTVNYTVSDSLDMKPNLTNSKSVQSTSQNVIISGLKPYTSYRISVKSHTKGSSGEFSNPILVRTAEGVPSAPVDIEWTLKTPTEIRISWSPPRNTNGKIVSYEISYRDKQTEDWKKIIQNGSASSHSVKELYKKEYLFKVRAVTSKGAGNFSTILPVLIPGKASTLAPSPPTESTLREPVFDMKLVIIICLVIAAIIIAIFVVVIIIRYRCFNACGRRPPRRAHSNHRPPVCAGNGNLNHHSSHHANGHAVQVPADEVQLDTYFNILPTLPENENLDAKGGGNVVVRPPAFKNGFTIPSDYHNGHMHNNIHAVEEDKVREPLLCKMSGKSKVPDGRSSVAKERTLGDSLEDIDHGDADVSQGPEEVDLDDSSTPLVSKSARREEAKSTHGTTTSPSGGALDLRRGDNRVIDGIADAKGSGTSSNQGRTLRGDSQKAAGPEAGSGEESQGGGGGASVAMGRFSGSSVDEPSLPLSEYQSNQTSHHSQVGGAGGGLAPPLAPPPLTGSTRPPSSGVTFTSTSVPQGLSQQQQQQPGESSTHHTSNLSDSTYSQRLPGPAADMAAGQPHIATATGVPSGHTGNAGLGDVELSLKPSNLALPLAAVSDGTSTTGDDNRRPQASA
ncbi:neogenin-like [Liolophura sinensis]|uniref:neogenin-like n=1 Tax=Liolophura sinensis TaxID=3198878 RepID=UPI0031580415